MKNSPKPVRKCRACGLNLGDCCAVYEVPRDKWQARDCPGYNNQDMLKAFQAGQAKLRVDERKQKRREKAKQRDSEPHWQGTLPVANR